MRALPLPVLLIAALTIQPVLLLAAGSEHPPELKVAELFEQSRVTGTFVLFDSNDSQTVIYNPERANQRFIPASTFKIPNSLIGLSSGAVESVEEVLPYGGEPQYLKIWEQDMGLRDAIRISNVPVYQELARRIGLQRMTEYVSLLDYGNTEIGNIVDRFWLQGPLEISAMEQADFLARLATQRLPLTQKPQTDVRDILLTETGDGWTLFAKTGWANSTTPAIGWWVGWVENDQGIFSFALNIDMPAKGDAKKRKELGMASLRLFGIIE